MKTNCVTEEESFMLDSTGMIIEVDNKASDNQKCFDYVTCVNGSKCQMICVTQGCLQSAIVCGNSQCPCYSNHQKSKLCQLARPKKIIEKLEKKKIITFGVISDVNEFLQNFVDWISQMKERLQIKLENIGLTEQQRFFLQLIYKRQFKELTGQQMSFVINQLEQEQRELEINLQRLKSELQKTWEEVIDPVQQQIGSLQKVVDKFNGEVGEHILDDSKVVLTKEQRNALFSFFPKKRKPVSSKLLFRAYEHNFSALKFNEMCFEKGNTVTVIKTQFNKVIGGYTPLKWKGLKAPNYGEWAEDTQKQSFLFSLTNKDKFTIKQGAKKQVYYHRDFGPVFGQDFDIAIFNAANSNKNSCANIGCGYENSKYAFNSAETWKRFLGGPTNNFKTLEWEIHELCFKD